MVIEEKDIDTVKEKVEERQMVVRAKNWGPTLDCVCRWNYNFCCGSECPSGQVAKWQSGKVAKWSKQLEATTYSPDSPSS